MEDLSETKSPSEYAKKPKHIERASDQRPEKNGSSKSPDMD